MTILQFLLARISEDEAVALEAIAEIERVAWASESDKPSTSDIEPLWVDPDGSGAHVAASPGRVIAECGAKRYILAQYRQVESTRGNDAQSRYSRTLEAMAAVYQDHAEFDPAWITTPSGPPPF